MPTLEPPEVSPTTVTVPTITEGNPNKELYQI